MADEAAKEVVFQSISAADGKAIKEFVEKDINISGQVTDLLENRFGKLFYANEAWGGQLRPKLEAIKEAADNITESTRVTPDQLKALHDAFKSATDTHAVLQKKFDDTPNNPEERRSHLAKAKAVIDLRDQFLDEARRLGIVKGGAVKEAEKPAPTTTPATPEPEQKDLLTPFINATVGEALPTGKKPGLNTFLNNITYVKLLDPDAEKKDLSIGEQLLDKLSKLRDATLAMGENPSKESADQFQALLKSTIKNAEVVQARDKANIYHGHVTNFLKETEKKYAEVLMATPALTAPEDAKKETPAASKEKGDPFTLQIDFIKTTIETTLKQPAFQKPSGIKTEMEKLQVMAEKMSKEGYSDKYMQALESNWDGAMKEVDKMLEKYPNNNAVKAVQYSLERIEGSIDKIKELQQPSSKEQGAVQPHTPAALADKIREELVSAGISVSGGTEQSGYLNCKTLDLI